MLIKKEIIEKAEDPDSDWALNIPVFSSPEEAKEFVNSFVKNLYENS